jgi:outer membrane protein W
VTVKPHLLIPLFLTLATLAAEAQVEQGAIPIGLAAPLGQTRTGDNYEATFAGIAATAGYFFTDNFGLGGGFSLTTRGIEVKDFPVQGRIYELTLRDFSASVFARQYFSVGDFRLYGHVGFQYKHFYNSRSKVKSYQLLSQVSVGASMFLNSNISLEGNVRYYWLDYQSATETSDLFHGPLELVLDFRPWLIERGGSTHFLADDYLDQGSWNLGGSVRFQYSFEDRDNPTGTPNSSDALIFSVAPKVGYFPMPNLLVGLEGGYSYSDDLVNNPIQFAFAPYARYYLRVADALQVVPNLSAGWRKTVYRQRSNTDKDEIAETTIIPGIGLHTFLVEGIGLFGNASVSLTSFSDSASQTQGNENTRVFQFLLGLEYYLSVK